jgi:acetyl-CoA synthetase|tara:strand:+ start:1873 stop:3810 length:1938 start_codon:yes stop_codon:yes gene_type:complete
VAKEKVYKVSGEISKNAHIDEKKYKEMYARSINDSDVFWEEQAEEFITWFSKWDIIQEWNFSDITISWFKNAKLNVSYNCIDRHLEKRGDQIAIIWEGDNPDDQKYITYRELHEEVCKFSNVLKSRGIKKGDCISIYMPMVPEAAVAMLACTRIGAIHSVVFGGFSPESLKDRILDSDCKLIVTADEGIRGGRFIPLKENVDIALTECPNVHTTVVIQRTGRKIAWNKNRDIFYHEAMEKVSSNCPAEEMDAEDPLFILYTSGSTGKPKGVLHSTAGYLLFTAMTHKYVFDYRDNDIYWCTADVGWVTGHSYIIYGPLCNGATTLMFEGVPTYPDASRFWQVVDKHKVNIFYTAPTAIRALMCKGEDFVKSTKRKSLRILGTVGEPINPEAWEWYYHVVGDGRCPIIDTWWQTETGGHLITPLPGATDLKPGSATLPFFGIEPCLVDEKGNEIKGAGEGSLCFKRSWPGQMRTVFGDHERFKNTYFTSYPGLYFSGDGARKDIDGYYWITGRIDDVINVSGHRMGTAEIESALVLHRDVAESAVVGYPHDIKGQGIYVYVTLNDGVQPSDELKQELLRHVRTEIGPFACPDIIQWSPGLPKTRSGKIMRRILRKIAHNEVDDLGDTSTLAEPKVVNNLIENRENK